MTHEGTRVRLDAGRVDCLPRQPEHPTDCHGAGMGIHPRRGNDQCGVVAECAVSESRRGLAGAGRLQRGRELWHGGGLVDRLSDLGGHASQYPEHSSPNRSI